MLCQPQSAEYSVYEVYVYSRLQLLFLLLQVRYVYEVYMNLFYQFIHGYCLLFRMTVNVKRQSARLFFPLTSL